MTDFFQHCTLSHDIVYTVCACLCCIVLQRMTWWFIQLCQHWMNHSLLQHCLTSELALILLFHTDWYSSFSLLRILVSVYWMRVVSFKLCNGDHCTLLLSILEVLVSIWWWLITCSRSILLNGFFVGSSLSGTLPMTEGRGTSNDIDDAANRFSAILFETDFTDSFLRLISRTQIKDSDS